MPRQPKRDQEKERLKRIIRQLWGYLNHGWALQLGDDLFVVEEIFKEGQPDDEAESTDGI